jgi:hypothetical protein
LVLVLWIAVGALVGIALLEGPITRVAALWGQGVTWAVVLATLRILAYVVLLVGLFWLGARIIGWVAATTTELKPRVGDTTPTSPEDVQGIGYPLPPTIPIGAWLAFATLVLVLGLIEVLSPSFFILDRFPGLSCGTGDEQCVDGRNLLVSIFAAGVGAMVTTTAGFLEHASEKKDFDVAYVPWYFARPVIGMLLGIIYYFVIKGGLFVTVGEVQSSELNVYGIAGLAALVGLFTKQATEKLRELFETMFVTREQVKEELKKQEQEKEEQEKEELEEKEKEQKKEEEERKAPEEKEQKKNG